MRDIDVVLFDHDGTLVDSIESVYSSTMYVLRMSGLAQISLKKFFEGLYIPFQDFLRELGVIAPPDQILAWYYTASNNAINIPFPDVYPVLTQLRSSGVTLGLVSANSETILRENLAREGIINLFTEIHGGVQKKAEVISDCALRYTEHSKRCLYVGDFPSDMCDATLAGVVPVGITRRYDTKALLTHYGAEMIIESLHELLPLVLKSPTR